MTEKLNMRERILIAAEKRVRASGFTEMSFRDVASDVGIKSASVHYHFPTKADLGNALIEAYTARFNASLEEIDTTHSKKALQSFISLYDQALVLNESICLCAILGAESIGLPKEMSSRTEKFFSMNIKWLQKIDGIDEALASVIVAALEGAMIIASTSDDREFFRTVSQKILMAIQ